MTYHRKTKPALWTTLPGAKVSKPKLQRPIKRESRKRRSERVIYRALAISFLHEHPKCKACNGPATQVHHVNGRGKYYLAVATWMPVCATCHQFIHNHPKEAMQAGWLATRA